MIDHSKWGRTALATFCRTDRIARIVTDAPAPPDLAAAAAQLGIGLLEASHQGPIDGLVRPPGASAVNERAIAADR